MVKQDLVDTVKDRGLMLDLSTASVVVRPETSDFQSATAPIVGTTVMNGMPITLRKAGSFLRRASISSFLIPKVCANAACRISASSM
ncbi:hypothetical protein AU476_05475 [Cupriavidus sp. UYMSc13B]|nr:hypothetical protein AU476_05475 [Cupriavidus sp. UYMSc13B]